MNTSEDVIRKAAKDIADTPEWARYVQILRAEKDTGDPAKAMTTFVNCLEIYARQSAARILA